MENFGCLKTDGHVCCNNTLTRNAVGAKVSTGAGVSANVITKTTMALSGDNGGGGKVHGVDVGQRWNFSSELFLTLAVGDNAPLLTSGQNLTSSAPPAQHRARLKPDRLITSPVPPTAFVSGRQAAGASKWGRGARLSTS